MLDKLYTTPELVFEKKTTSFIECKRFKLKLSRFNFSPKKRKGTGKKDKK